MKAKKTIINFSKRFIGIVLISSFFFSCKKHTDVIPDPLPTPPIVVKPNVVFYGLTADNQIIKYNALTAENAGSAIAVTGLQPSETLMSIDFRPATGQLYGLGSTSRLYTINLNTGAATPQGITSFTPSISGTIANIDFNPTVDRVRLVTNTGQNLRLNPETGAVAATDMNINGGASPAINSIAYTNSMAGATTTDLYDIDFTTKKLYKQNPPNNGTLEEIGSLNVPIDAKAGFDIIADNSVALATLPLGTKTKLYGINLTTAAATFYVDIAATLIDIAIPTQSVAYATSTAGSLQIFNPTNTSTLINKSITGLTAGESILGIDFRPVNGQLYAVAATTLGAAKLYTINLATGAATGLGVGFALGTGVTAAGIDFNPTVDRIRFVTNTGLNMRLNPNDGTVAATDLPLNPGTPNVTSAAYTNNFAGATSTTLFVLDASTLYIQSPPNAGTLVSTGSLGITTTGGNGFDIGGTSYNAFGMFTVGSTTKIYTINLNSGLATALSDYPNTITGMAVGLGF